MPRTSRRLQWSCSSYRRTGWIDPNDLREYCALFQALDTDGSWVRCTIRFCTRHPVLTLRQITAGPKTSEAILAFHERTFN